jgi:hypothetical protein
MELGADARCARDGDPLRGLVVRAILVGCDTEGLDCAGAEGVDLALERMHGDAHGVRHPPILVLGPDHADEEPGLAPGEIAANEGRLDAGKRPEPLVDPREILDLAG